MSFALRAYTAPDFSKKEFVDAPTCVWLPAPADQVAPEGYHAMSIFPEYFKIGNTWVLAPESREASVSKRLSACIGNAGSISARANADNCIIDLPESRCFVLRIVKDLKILLIYHYVFSRHARYNHRESAPQKC